MPSPSQISVDLPIEVLGGLVTQFDPQKLPMGASPFNQDVSFYTSGGVKTRPGMQNLYAAAFAGNPTVNYLRTFVDISENFRQMSLDGNGNVYQEFPPLTVAAIGGVTPGAFIQSDTYAGKEWMAVGDGAYGLDIPRHWDGVNFDRCSQVGPGTAPVVNDFLPAAATIGTAGGGSSATIIAGANGEQAVGPLSLNPFPPPKFVTNYVVVTTTAPHGFSVGQFVTLTGDNVGGTWLIFSVPSPTTFKFAYTLPNGGSVPVNLGGGGTASVGPPATTTIQRQANVVTAQTTTPHGFAVGWPVQVSGIPAIATGGATSAGSVGGVVTAATATPHGLVVGAQVIIAGMSDASFNGTYIVQTVPSATLFTYAQNTTTNSASGGTTSCTFDGTFVITAIPSLTSFQYTQLGPNQTSTSSGAATIVGWISPGLHQVSVVFLTRSGYITCPAIPNSFIAGGGKFAAVSQIPIGPPEVIARILLFTPAITPPATAGPFFYLAATMQINDNISTSAVVNFLDAVLESGTPATALFNLLELGECSGVRVYSERTFWTGERNKVNSAGGGGGFNNLTFDGGFGTDSLGRTYPLGWSQDAANYTGGSSALALGQTAYYGDAYAMTGDGVTAVRGLITQAAFQDYLQVPVLTINTAYSVRFRAHWFHAGGGAPTAGNLIVEVFSPSLGSLGIASVAFNVLTATYAEYILPLLASQTTLPADLQLRVYANGTLDVNTTFLIDCIEPFPTLQPVNRTIVRCSLTEQPEAFDSETGQMIVGLDNGQSVRSLFWLLDNKLYLVKERSLYGTNDDGQNEPDLWTISTISQTVGSPSVNGSSGTGETWGTIASHDGCYIFDGTTPKKIIQENQPLWDTINWAEGTTIYTVIDTARKRIHVGAPVNLSVTPNVEFVLDYGHLATAQDIVDHPQAYYSAYQPTKIIAPGRARKWTLWNLQMNSAALTVRADGSYHLLRGNGTATGKVYDQLESQKSDDGAAINFQYQTYFAPETEQEEALQLGSHRKLLKYLTGYAWGNGIMFFTVTGPQGQRAKSLSSLILQLTAHWDFEMNANWVGERFSIIFGVVNQPGGWGELTKLCPTVQREIMTPVRGVA